MMQWKGRISGGLTVRQPVTSLDIHPTAVAAAGKTVSPDWKLDGVNLLPHLTGGTASQPPR